MISTLSEISCNQPLSSRANNQNNKENVFNLNTIGQGELKCPGAFREFGKDITNSKDLTENQSLEYLKPNIIKKTTIPKIDIKKGSEEQKEEDLTNKFKEKEINSKQLNTIKDNLSLNSSSTLNNKNKINENLNNSTSLDTRVPTSLGDSNINKENASDDLCDILEETTSKMEKMQIGDNIKSKGKENIKDIEVVKEERKNIQQVDDYLDDIYLHFQETECNFRASPGYMSNQSDINEKMRAILLDWLVEVHLKYKMVPETLFLTVNIIDRYLQKNVIMRTKLQLVGVAAMMIASKYEDIYPPEVKSFSYITDHAYKVQEIKKMEENILSSLEYNVTVVSVLNFLECYKKKMKLDEQTFHFAWYLSELCLIDYKMLKYKYSEIAASACLVALKLLKKRDSSLVSKYTNYTDEKLKECSRDICLIVNNSKKSKLVAIQKKFSLEKLFKVSKIETKMIFRV